MNKYRKCESLRKTYTHQKPRASPISNKVWIWCIYITEAIKAAATYELLSRWGILYLNCTRTVFCVFGLSCVRFGVLFFSFPWAAPNCKAAYTESFDDRAGVKVGATQHTQQRSPTASVYTCVCYEVYMRSVRQKGNRKLADDIARWNLDPLNRKYKYI